MSKNNSFYKVGNENSYPVKRRVSMRHHAQLSTRKAVITEWFLVCIEHQEYHLYKKKNHIKRPPLCLTYKNLRAFKNRLISN